MYIPLYLWAEGRLSIGERWYKFHLSKPNQQVQYARRKSSLGMLFYPFAYSLVVLPFTVARWSLYDHKNTPSTALLFGLTVFNLSGAINVLLFLIIRPHLLLFAPPKQPIEPEIQLSRFDTMADPVVSLDTARYDRKPEPTRIESVGGIGEQFWKDSRISAELPHVNPTLKFDDI